MVDDASTDADLAGVWAEVVVRADTWRQGEGGAVEHDVEAAITAAVPGRAGDVDGLLERAGRQIVVEALPPMGTPRPSVRLAKQVVRRATFGSLAHLAAQVGALGATLVAASRALDARVSELERRFGCGVRLPPLAALPEGALDEVVATLVGLDLPPSAGPAVVHVGAGEGALLARLADRGLAGWGIEQDAAAVVVARAAGIDVRLDPPAGLADAAPGSVAAVVLGRAVDLLRVADLAATLGTAKAVLRAGGVLVVTTLEPTTFARLNPVHQDLAAARPLHLATWAHLLAGAGFDAVEARQVEGEHGSVRIVIARAGPP